LEELTSDRVRARASLATPGYLVLVDAFDPGWRVSLDGRPAPLLRANVAFRGVSLPAGTHEVEFLYRPWSVEWGIAFSIASFLVGGVIFLRDKTS
jgi:uncharacterized membrane protein YfhO